MSRNVSAQYATLPKHEAASQQERRIQDVNGQSKDEDVNEPKRQISAFLSQVYPKKGYLARGLQRDLGGLKTEHLPHEVRALVAKVPFVEQADARPFASCGPSRVAEKARGAHQHVHVG